VVPQEGVGVVAESATTRPSEFDIVIVGAGFAGIYMLYRAQQLGLNAVTFEKGDGVGGTWYWNKYPGARVDTRSLLYSYSFASELEQEWEWTELYAAQPEIESYANWVVDRLGLRNGIRLSTRVEGAAFDDKASRWTVTLAAHEQVISKYLVLATGGYSVPSYPAIPGLEEFNGELVHTGQWPQDGISLARKRIGVLGTGSSGAQVSAAISNKPVEHLYVFHRTASFVVNNWNRLADSEYTSEFKKQYREFRAKTRATSHGLPYPAPLPYPDPLGLPPEPFAAAAPDDAEFQQKMWTLWELGTHVMVSAVTDLGSSTVGNRRVADFLRERVRERVHDPLTAELLCPDPEMFVGERRLILDSDYLGIFNKPHVSLVDVKSDPIKRITPKGVIRMSGDEISLDVLVLATGFDSATGSIRHMELIGAEGVSIEDKWSDGAETFLGLMVNGFPNLFLVAQVGSPGIRSQVLNSIEAHVEWIADLIAFSEANGLRQIQPSHEAEVTWTQHVAEVAAASITTTHDTQYWGQNVPGKPRQYLAYIGGVDRYQAICDGVRDSDYECLLLTKSNGSVMGGAKWSPPAWEREARTGGI
jgi:cyclohexanone monooxygenase